MSYKLKKMLNTYHAIGQLSRMSNSYFFLFSLQNRSFLSPGDNLHEISICLLSGKIMKKFINLSSAEFAHRVVYKIQTYKIQLKRKSKIHTWVTNWKLLPCNGQIQQMSNSYFFLLENRILHFMQIVSLGDNLHEISHLIFHANCLLICMKYQILLEDRILHFMQIVSLHEISDPYFQHHANCLLRQFAWSIRSYFLEKKKKMKSAKIFTQHAKF